MWKVIYIAQDILSAKNLVKVLKNQGIATILNQLEMNKDELRGNVEILVPKCEAREAVNKINQALVYDNNLLDDID
jgi:glucan phosphoethanolaminetransferase (alkaline phosphatase superfamily)